MEMVMLDLAIEFWAGGLTFLKGGVGIYLALRANAALRKMSRQLEAARADFLAQNALR